MQLARLRIAILVAVVPALVHCAADPESPEEDAAESSTGDELAKEPSLTFGTWISPTCEKVDERTFQLRTYQIAANGVFADWRRFSSPTCAADSVLMTIRQGGSSTIDRQSRTLRFTSEIRVFIDEKAIVPESAAGIQRLQEECASNDWEVGTEVDVTRAGCGDLVPAREVCPVEYDLLKLSGSRLYFGDRSDTLCTEATRPKKLSVWSVQFDHLL